MASVLRGPEVHVARLVGVTDPLLVDPAWQHMLDEARAEGHRAGFEEGRRVGREETVAEVEAASESIRRAVEDTRAEIRRTQEETAASLLRTAFDLVERLIGDLPVEPTVLVDKVRAALDELDSPHLEVRVGPDMVEFVTSSVADDARVTVVADPSLGRGEARIVGEWCDADLTWETALEILREVLGA